MAAEIRVAGLPLPNRKWQVGDNLERLKHWTIAAARDGANLVVAPECYLDGYCLTDLRESQIDTPVIERYASISHVWPDSPILQALASLAGQLGIYLVCGGVEYLEGHFYNAAFFFGPEGPLGRYHKTHISWERLLHTPGDELRPFMTPWGKVGILICFDRQFPEAARALALAGACLIIVPSNGMYGGINDHMMQVRAYENNAYLLFVHPLDCLVVSPRGRIIAANEEAGFEEVVIRPVDLARAEQIRKRSESLLSERRPSVYTCLLDDPSHSE